MIEFDHQIAEHYDANAHRWSAFGAMHDMVVAALGAHLPEKATVALVGVGTGQEAVLLRERFPAWKLIGVDPSEAMLTKARQKLGDEIELKAGTLQDHREIANVDALTLVGVLHHLNSVEEQRDLLRVAHQRLKPGGLLVLGTQVGPYVAGSLRETTLNFQRGNPGHQLQLRQHSLPLTSEGLTQALTEAGFQRWERLFAAIYFEVWAAIA